MIISLSVILLLVLFLPFLVKKVEENLELFLFVMGLASVTITAQWSNSLLNEAAYEPIKITVAVFFAGLLFERLQAPLARNIKKISLLMGSRFFVFLVIVLLGFLSSVITAIVAALILVEIVAHLKFNRRNETIFVVLACFSIGLGAALTPIGEPLATIAIAKLKGAPYHAGFFFLFETLKLFVVPGVVLFGLLGAIMVSSGDQLPQAFTPTHPEGSNDVLIRSGKVYLFVMALVFLGQGFKPIVDAYIDKIPYQGLYWLNMISAVLDNATLTAAEIGPGMSIVQIKSALIGLLVAGGMLIPGNIPNIIAAGRLKIKSSEWARYGVPLGLAVMVLFFIMLMVVK